MNKLTRTKEENLVAGVTSAIEKWVGERKSLAYMREHLTSVRSEFPEFTLWGPEVDSGKIIVTVIGWPHPISFYAPEWCQWERGGEMPVTP